MPTAAAAWEYERCGEAITDDNAAANDVLCVNDGVANRSRPLNTPIDDIELTSVLTWLRAYDYADSAFFNQRVQSTAVTGPAPHDYTKHDLRHGRLIEGIYFVFISYGSRQAKAEG